MKKTQRPRFWASRRVPQTSACAGLSASYMSDAKWRKALGAIADAGVRIERATWKFIDSDYLHEWGVPRRSEFCPTRLADGMSPPEEYRWIEWIHFPRCWRPATNTDYAVTQDLEGLKRALDAVGRFRYLEDEKGLTLFGYDR